MEKPESVVESMTCYALGGLNALKEQRRND